MPDAPRRLRSADRRRPGHARRGHPIRGRRGHRVPDEADGARSPARRRSRTIRARLTDALERETRFGIGASFRGAAPARRDGRRLARDGADLAPEGHVRGRSSARAAAATTSSSSAELTVLDDAAAACPRGTYLALLSHSGSRGTGRAGGGALQPRWRASTIRSCRRSSSHLAWLDLSTEAGQEYWAAMELMGRYAAANHALIHAHDRAGRSASRCCSTSRTTTTSHGASGIGWPTGTEEERHRAPQGRDAGRRRRARHHSRLDGARPATSSAGRAWPRR